MSYGTVLSRLFQSGNGLRSENISGGPEGAARSFLKAHADLFGAAGDGVDFRLRRERASGRRTFDEGRRKATAAD